MESGYESTRVRGNNLFVKDGRKYVMVASSSMKDSFTRQLLDGVIPCIPRVSKIEKGFFLSDITDCTSLVDHLSTMKFDNMAVTNVMTNIAAMMINLNKAGIKIASHDLEEFVLYKGLYKYIGSYDNDPKGPSKTPSKPLSRKNEKYCFENEDFEAYFDNVIAYAVHKRGYGITSRLLKTGARGSEVFNPAKDYPIPCSLIEFHEFHREDIDTCVEQYREYV